ncbi:hypothetical protein L226DRAFT_469733, partial [Lentinus tigrinus ALCF2SS1-7]
QKSWTFARGALATVDRPVFGWIGWFFWHGISSTHVAHHFFVSIPFYNLPQVTEVIKPVLGEYYCYDSTPTMYALWRSFTQCTFIEDEGDVVFFKNQHGEAVREYVEPEPRRRRRRRARAMTRRGSWLGSRGASGVVGLRDPPILPPDCRP